jgi:hypothetical protein
MNVRAAAWNVPLVLAVAAALSACVVTACGGGDGSVPTSSGAAAPPPPSGPGPPPPAPSTASCAAGSGSLNLQASAVRGSGISPLLVFFDATGTTDGAIKANTTTFQDVYYSWNFGDGGASGTGTWAYGANPGKNSRNTATGGVAAHLYVTNGADTPYTVTVTAYDGTNTASCQLAVTAYDPSGSSGFPGTETTCVSASGTPTAGSDGCPAGAAVLNTASVTTALGSRYMGAGRRVLFKCGDSFSGSSPAVAGVKWSIGAYGGCENSTSNRPIITGGNLNVHMQATGDGRIADLDLESNGAKSAVWIADNFDYVNYQMTLYNLLSSGNNESFYVAQCSQCGYVQLVQTGMRNNQGTFVNYAENNQSQWGSNSLYNNINYQAMLGGSYNGQGAPNSGAGIETVRVSACRMCVFSNNTIENANNVGAVLKLHNGNTKNSAGTWTGVYTELIEISDNLFSGTSGAQLVETSPQNGVTDERLRNIVIERNVFAPAAGSGSGRELLVGAVNETVRDNVFYGPSTRGVQIARRGLEPVPQFVEVYNNTCSGLGSCADFSGDNFAAPGIDSWAMNNLCYKGTCVGDNGTGNTVSNNSPNTSADPGFIDGSGTFSTIADFKPTSNYSGASDDVPVYYDALGVAWSPDWELGALHP